MTPEERAAAICATPNSVHWDKWKWRAEIEDAIRRATEQEREECARALDVAANTAGDVSLAARRGVSLQEVEAVVTVLRGLAAVIRARGQTK